MPMSRKMRARLLNAVFTIPATSRSDSSPSVSVMMANVRVENCRRAAFRLEGDAAAVAYGLEAINTPVGVYVADDARLKIRGMSHTKSK